MNWQPLHADLWSTEYQGSVYYVVWDDYTKSAAYLWKQDSRTELRKFSGTKEACLAQIELWKLTLPEILMEDAL